MIDVDEALYEGEKIPSDAFLVLRGLKETIISIFIMGLWGSLGFVRIIITALYIRGGGTQRPSWWNETTIGKTIFSNVVFHLVFWTVVSCVVAFGTGS